jgi:hypothetical protein
MSDPNAQPFKSPAWIHDMGVTTWQKQTVDIDTDPGAVPEQLSRAPAFVAYWNAAAADAVRAHRKAERARKEVYARLHTELVARKRGGEKLTEADMDSAIVLDARMVAACEVEDDAEAHALRVQAFAKAADAKLKALQGINATVRSEMEGSGFAR